MKFFKSWIIGFVVLASTHAAGAVDAPDVKVRDSFYVNLGGTTPLEPGSFTADQNVGYNFGIGYGFGLSKLFQLVLDLNSDNFPLNPNSGPSLSGGDVHIGTFLVNARFRFIAQDNPVVPYLIGGMGAARVDQDQLSQNGAVIGESSSTTDFAARLGIGMDIRLSRSTALFLESNGYGVSNSNGASNIRYNSFRIGGRFNL